MYILNENNDLVIYAHDTNAYRRIIDVMMSDVARLYGAFRADRSFFLMHLYVPIAARGRGVASCLLVKLVDYIRECGCRRIDVDDISRHYRKNHNIYVKYGFVYRSKLNMEMYASPQCVQRLITAVHKL